MDIRYKINEDDFLQFHHSHIISSDAIRGLIKPFLISLLILLSICVIFSPMRVGLIIGTVFVFLFHKIIFSKYRKKTLKESLRKKVFESDIYRNIFQTTNLLIMDTGIKTETCYGRKYFTWQSLYDIHLTDAYVIIRTISDEIIYIPCKVINKDEFCKIFSNYTDLSINKCYPTNLKYKKYFV